MTKWLTAFLELKNEADGTRKGALIAIALITISLAMLSISGAWAKSEGDWLAFIPRLFYACLVLGLELLAAVLFVRALVASHWMQSAVCCAMLLFLAWANVQNSKDGVHFIMPTRFAETGETLSEKAALAGEEAVTLGDAQKAALANSGTELAKVRSDIAELKVEQDILGNMSPEGVEKAQTSLQSKGLYNYKVDGISNAYTERARRERGEQIQKELAKLKAREDGFMAGQASPVQQATSDKRLQEIETRAKAREATASGWRLEIILWVSEIARSLGLWAAIASVRIGQNNRTMERREELEDAEHQAKLAAIRAGMAQAPTPAPEPIPVQPVPEPVVAPPPAEEPIAAEAPPEPVPEPQPEPEVVPEPEPELVLDTPAEPEPEMTDAQRRSRSGGLAAGHNRAAAKARAEAFIPVPSLVARDQQRAAMKVAAE